MSPPCRLGSCHGMEELGRGKGKGQDEASEVVVQGWVNSHQRWKGAPATGQRRLRSQTPGLSKGGGGKTSRETENSPSIHVFSGSGGKMRICSQWLFKKGSSKDPQS